MGAADGQRGGAGRRRQRVRNWTASVTGEELGSGGAEELSGGGGAGSRRACGRGAARAGRHRRRRPPLPRSAPPPRRPSPPAATSPTSHAVALPRHRPTLLAAVLELVFFYLPRAPAAASLPFSRVGARARAAAPRRRQLPDPALAAQRRRAFLVRACSSEGCPLDGLRLQRVRSWAVLGRTREQSSDGSTSMAAVAAQMSHSMALLGWSTPRWSWMS
uniref:Uncharacterized protein n=1 Tax=Oryza rufipogon TaxID=4529 RepID=A0A0E0R3B5_ORYRU